MAERSRHIALVLAAGGSRRLGQPKQLLSRDGETLVHRACRLAADTLPARTLLLCGAHAEAVRAAVADLPIQALHNADWEHGLASSLAAAAGALPEDDTPLLILGCDQPALSLAHLQSLLDAAQRVARRSGRCHAHAATGYDDAVGMPAVVPASRLRAGAGGADSGLRKLLNRLDADCLGVIAAPALALDIDTPEDMAAARDLGLIDAV